VNAQLDTFVKEKFVGNLEHYAGTIASIDLAAARAAMLHVFKHCQCISDNLMGFVSLDIRDESYATRITLKCRIVKTSACHSHKCF
jgi:hypothetical protein